MDESMSFRKLQSGQVFAGKYKLLEKIGAGSFGCVYKTQNLKNGELVAAKFEKRDNSLKGVSLLVREIKVLSEVAKIKGFPVLRFYGRDENHNFFMESYLGINLEQQMKKCNGKFSLNTTLGIGVQLVERLQDFHDKNLIHRDIKPENFTIGISDPGTIYAIDFGLAKYYRDSHQNHIPFIQNKGLIGTARYASINALLGNEQSRRDDLEALLYMLIYLFQGSLPWQNIAAESKDEKYKMILKMKQDNVFENDESIPKQFIKVLKYVKGLEFTQAPNYDYIKEILSEEHLVDRMEWEQEDDFREKRLSVSIDLQEEENSHILQTSLKKIVQQDPKFINGKLSHSNILEVPRLSIVMNDANSPSGIIRSTNSKNSIGTSKANHYEKSHNFVSAKQFKSCTQLLDEQQWDVDEEETPSLHFQNLVVTRQYSKH